MYDSNLSSGVVLGSATTTGSVALLAETGATQTIATVLTGLLIVLFAVSISGITTKKILRRKHK